VDYPCDVGRSVPPEGDPSRCPNSEEEIASWVEQVLSQLLPPPSDKGSDNGENAPKKATLIGYSYGAAVAMFTAIHRLAVVDKLVLLAPASLLDDLSPGFLWHAMILALFRGDWGQNYFLKWVSSPTSPNGEYNLDTVPVHERNQLVAIREVAATVLSVPTPNFNDTVLGEVFGRHPAFVGVGEHEKLLRNASGTASARALRNGAQVVRVYPNAGHLMLVEAGDRVARDVVAFLNDGSLL
jgi:pimeloyl-ACP methyl ester carboxylesterase